MSEQDQGTDPTSNLRVVTDDSMSPEEKLLSDNESIIAEARAKHGKIAIFEAPDGFSGVVIIAKPTNPKTFQNFVNNVAKPETDKSVETVNFAKGCVVHPADRAAVATMFNEQPAFALVVAGRGQELCGSATKELGKG